MKTEGNHASTEGLANPRRLGAHKSCRNRRDPPQRSDIGLMRTVWGVLLFTFLAILPASASDGRTWLAGDHHVHSLFSGEYLSGVKIGDVSSYTLGADGIYPIAVNAGKARQFGLSWVVATDHGGPGLSRLHYEQSYAELLKSRQSVPDLIQFFGLELNTPGGDHASLILPVTPDERARLLRLETAFDAKEIYPPDPARDTNALMLDALRAMDGLAPKPLVFANHPSRGASFIGDPKGGHTPADMRSWSDAAPDVAVGMEGAPGHQAASLKSGIARGRIPKPRPVYVRISGPVDASAGCRGF